MIAVQIGDIKKDITHASAAWLHEQIARRRRDGEPVCVQVFVDRGDVHIRLATPDCLTKKGGRLPSLAEKKLFDLWQRHGLNDSGFTGDNLMAFLKQVS